MKIHDVIVLIQVKEDLIDGKEFYDLSEEGIGSYFFDSIVSDIESLKIYAGIHSKHYGLYRMLSKRFPFAIYYDIRGSNSDSCCCIGFKEKSRLDSQEIKKESLLIYNIAQIDHATN